MQELTKRTACDQRRAQTSCSSPHCISCSSCGVHCYSGWGVRVAFSRICSKTTSQHKLRVWNTYTSQPQWTWRNRVCIQGKGGALLAFQRSLEQFPMTAIIPSTSTATSPSILWMPHSSSLSLSPAHRRAHTGATTPPVCSSCSDIIQAAAVLSWRFSNNRNFGKSWQQRR